MWTSKNVLMCGAAAALALLAGQPAAAKWTTVVNSASPIPGANGNFSSFNQPSINDNCLVVFRGRGKGPQEPARGVYLANPCSVGFNSSTSLEKLAATGDSVPQPNNLDGTFNEFPSIPRIDRTSNLVATRGQHAPVWSYMLKDGTETRVGTAGVYAAVVPEGGMNQIDLTTAASQVGRVKGLRYFDVPGFQRLKFDQFPGSPAAFRGNLIAFKGNFNPRKSETKTGVYFRRAFSLDGGVKKIADSTDLIPGSNLTFGSTAPPSADGTTVVFNGSDFEDAPTAGGLYRYDVTTQGPLETLVSIGGPAPSGNTFTKFSEGLSYDGRNLGFWGSWGTRTRTVRLHCPKDGQSDVIAECIVQCPDQDETGHYCDKEVPLHQGIFVRRPDGSVDLVAKAAPKAEFQDFLYWVFSGAPPREGSDAEPPRWRSSPFVAITALGETGVATAFKGSKANGETGIYISKRPGGRNRPAVLVGDASTSLDPAAPASNVSAVGLEREGFRNCRLAISASFVNETTSESWAGIYVKKNGCR
jgi:hypothetical protein